MAFNTLLTASNNGIYSITINRPDKMNALNIELIGELERALDEAIQSDDVRGIIITGTGDKAFAAGADIAEFASFRADQAKALAENGHRIFNKIEQCTKPVIAAVNGFALGGGCELAMSCHMRIASTHAQFGQPEVKLGVIPGYGGTQRLVRYIGRARATEFLLTADMIDAGTALQLGLVNYVTAPDQLLIKCEEIMKKVAGKSPLVVKQVLDCVDAYYHKQTDGFELEIQEFSNCFNTDDFKEGTSAFLEKRKPSFKGT
ncbi:MAG: enoyl-CoA hydratase/isomerase family protein [Bacteroidetes bacterium]|nr:enoyl-CoA hydratase/isomerase family protein [Bacteroidota bacterium]